MAYGNDNLFVSYDELDAKKSAIQRIINSGNTIANSIEAAKSSFSITNSDTSDKLINALEIYSEAHASIIALCECSQEMLEKAKYVYENSDQSMADALNGDD